MQIKNTMRYHSHTNYDDDYRKNINQQVFKRMWKTGSLCTVGANSTTPIENSRAVSQNIKK